MPAISSTFRSGEPALQGLLEDIHLGKIQLPDFQRPWVWDDDHIRDLTQLPHLADRNVHISRGCAGVE